MGMPVSLALRGRHARTSTGERAWAEVVAELHEVDRVFSTYRADSAVSRLSRGDVALDDCPREVADVLDLGEAARVQSDGAFDVYRRDDLGRVVLDPSAVVKGWAVQRASAHLRALPDTDFCLSAGGDMACWVADPAGTPWQVGVEDALDPQRLIARIPLARGAIATSGLHHRGNHIVDARSGAVPRGVASVTVVADDLTWADIDATAAFAHGSGALTWLRNRPGRRGVVVWADGRAEVFGPA